MSQPSPSDAAPGQPPTSKEVQHSPGDLFLRDLFRVEAQDIAAIISLIALVGFFSIVTNGFWQPNVIREFFRQGAPLLLLASGLTFVLLCGEIDLSVGVMATFAGCFCGWFHEMMAPDGDGASGWLLELGSVLLPLLVAAGVGVITGLVTVWTKLGSFIITLAVMFVLNGAALVITQGTSFHSPPVVSHFNEDWVVSDTLRNPFWELMGWQIRVPHMTWLALGAVALAFFVLRYTRFGRYVYMTGGNREAARLAGVRTNRVLVSALTISAVCAAAAGLLQGARLGSYSATDNPDLLLNAVACVVLGGTSLFGGSGGVIRTVIGVCIFVVLSIGLQMVPWIDDHARKMLLGIVLLLALILNGLLAQDRFQQSMRRLFNKFAGNGPGG